MTVNEFLFWKADKKRRDKSESLHDVLIAAKDGLNKTRIMYAACLSYKPMLKLLKSAKAARLIEEVEVPPSYWRKKSIRGWKTTEKGLKYAQGVYDNAKLLEEVEG